MNIEMDKCHYCGSFTSNVKDNYFQHTMYGVVKSNLIRGTGYTYTEQKVKIPRCETCMKRHNNQFLYIELPLFIIGFSYTVWYFTTEVSDDGFRFLSLIPSVVAGTLCAGIIGQIIRFFMNFSEKSGKLEDDIEDYKEVRQLLNLGWKISKPAKGEHITDDDLIITSPHKKK